MEVSVSLFTAIVILTVVNTILTHLLNWMYRAVGKHAEGGEILIALFVSAIRWIMVYLIIVFITQGL